MLIAGIDPGLTGAFAVYDTEKGRITAVWDIPTLEVKRGKTCKRQLNLHSLNDLFLFHIPRTVFCEDVGGMPGQSAPAAFNFGKSVGILEALFCSYSVSVTRVPPAKWKKALQVSSEKDSARARASQLIPDSSHWWTRKKDHNRAEAALIAYYGALTLGEMRHAA